MPDDNEWIRRAGAARAARDDEERARADAEARREASYREQVTTLWEGIESAIKDLIAAYNDAAKRPVIELHEPSRRDARPQGHQPHGEGFEREGPHAGRILHERVPRDSMSDCPDRSTLRNSSIATSARTDSRWERTDAYAPMDCPRNQKPS